MGQSHQCNSWFLVKLSQMLRTTKTTYAKVASWPNKLNLALINSDPSL